MAILYYYQAVKNASRIVEVSQYETLEYMGDALSEFDSSLLVPRMYVLVSVPALSNVCVFVCVVVLSEINSPPLHTPSNSTFHTSNTCYTSQRKWRSNQVKTVQIIIAEKMS